MYEKILVGLVSMALFIATFVIGQLGISNEILSNVANMLYVCEIALMAYGFGFLVTTEQNNYEFSGEEDQ